MSTSPSDECVDSCPSHGSSQTLVGPCSWSSRNGRILMQCQECAGLLCAEHVAPCEWCEFPVCHECSPPYYCARRGSLHRHYDYYGWWFGSISLAESVSDGPDESQVPDQSDAAHQVDLEQQDTESSSSLPNEWTITLVASHRGSSYGAASLHEVNMSARLECTADSASFSLAQCQRTMLVLTIENTFSLHHLLSQTPFLTCDCLVQYVMCTQTRSML